MKAERERKQNECTSDFYRQNSYRAGTGHGLDGPTRSNFFPSSFSTIFLFHVNSQHFHYDTSPRFLCRLTALIKLL